MEGERLRKLRRPEAGAARGAGRGHFKGKAEGDVGAE